MFSLVKKELSEADVRLWRQEIRVEGARTHEDCTIFMWRHRA